ncbi:MAG: hypothetical protein O2822_03245, partial [Chloroflexi bacterium]|nr:hypothetical protein [Chloroflexota bacterium]
MTDVRVEIVLGSVTPPGRMHSAVLGSAQRATVAGFGDVAVLDLADVRTGFAGGAPPADDGMAGAIERL